MVFLRSLRSRLSESLTGRWMFPPAGFDSSFEFAAKTMLLDTEASSLVLRAETPLRPPQKEAASIRFPAEVKMPVLIILIVVSVLGFLCVLDSVISAARRGPARVNNPACKRNARGFHFVSAKPKLTTGTPERTERLRMSIPWDSVLMIVIPQSLARTSR